MSIVRIVEIDKHKQNVLGEDKVKPIPRTAISQMPPNGTNQHSGPSSVPHALNSRVSVEDIRHTIALLVVLSIFGLFIACISVRLLYVGVRLCHGHNTFGIFLILCALLLFYLVSTLRFAFDHNRSE
jgi:hypothetical protein